MTYIQAFETDGTGTRHQEAARPAARGHYILHSPRDPLADDPDKNRQRDFKLILAYEITTPTSEHFGEVQKELGLAPKDAVALQVKDPDAQSNNNPRAAMIPRDKRAQLSLESGSVVDQMLIGAVSGTTDVVV